MTLNVSTPVKPVHQLLYRSRCLTETDSALQMSDILAEARPANARDGITGALTAVNGRFVQIVEGDAEVIDALMERLQRDRRHADLVVRERRVVSQRAFADWDMVSPRLTPQEIAMLALLLDDPNAGLDAFAAVLTAAVAHQESLLRGRGPSGLVGRGPARPRETPSAADAEV